MDEERRSGTDCTRATYEKDGLKVIQCIVYSISLKRHFVEILLVLQVLRQVFYSVRELTFIPLARGLTQNRSRETEILYSRRHTSRRCFPRRLCW